MKNKTITKIIILAILSFAGIVLIQTIWLKKAVRVKEDELDLMAKNALDAGFHNRNINKELTAAVNGNRNTNFEQQNFLIIAKSVSDSIFRSNNIYDSYEMAVIPCGCDEIIFSSDSTLNNSYLHSKTKTPLNISHDTCGDHYFLSVVFTSKNKFLFSQLGPQLGLYVLLLLIMTCVFGYTIISLRKQKKLTELKNDFINNMTHELKTPIASIRLASRMLKKDEEVPARQQGYINLIENESCRLENQVDKVLQAAVLDTGNFQLEKTNIDVHDIIRKVANTFRVIIQNKEGFIQMDLAAANPVIYADEIHLTNVLYNLLDNAIKYCSRPPEIMISTSDHKKGLNITVKDNGIGMTSTAQQNIFEKFYRAESGTVHNVKGFGLGLSYVKSIIDAHKGSINIQSTINSGSEFNLFLPSL